MTWNEAEWEEQEMKREADAIAAINAHFKAGGKFQCVTHKSESGSLGPVYAYREGFEGPEMMPFDAPDPDGMWYMGWRTRGAARKIAKALGTQFEDA